MNNWITNNRSRIVWLKIILSLILFAGSSKQLLGSDGDFEFKDTFDEETIASSDTQLFVDASKPINPFSNEMLSVALVN